MPDVSTETNAELDQDVSDTGDITSDNSEDQDSATQPESAETPEVPEGYVPEGKYNEVMGHNKALNKKLVEARRQANLRRNDGSESNQAPAPSNQGEYVTQIKTRMSEVRNKLSDVFRAYPEMPDSWKVEFYQNPQRYIGNDFYETLNVANALLDIEQTIADALASQQAGNSQQQTATNLPKKNVSPNAVDPEGDVAEKEEDENLWTTDMATLEKKARAEYARRFK